MCVFCKIISGEFGSYKVFEDDKILAILDLSQTTYGHTLVMPKKHYPDILAIPSDELEYLMIKTQAIAGNLVDRLNAKGFNLLVNTGSVAGQTVEHLHIHIIPRYGDDDKIKIEMPENDYNKDEIIAKIKK